MKKLIIASLFLLGITGLHAQQQTIVGTDIDNFWIAYDKIVSTTDTVLQFQYLNDLYIMLVLFRVCISIRFDNYNFPVAFR